MIDTNTPQGPCGHCGLWHSGPCSRIKAIEYYENGMVKRIEYVDQPMPLPQPPQEYSHFTPGGITYVQPPSSPWYSCTIWPQGWAGSQ